VALPNSSAFFGTTFRVSAQSQWRRHASDTPGQPTAETSSPETAPDLGGEHSDGASLEIDSEGKTIKTAVGELPLSPIMDPTFWEARERFKKKKPKPGKAETAIEREFRKNPFGKASTSTIMKRVISQFCSPCSGNYSAARVDYEDTITELLLARFQTPCASRDRQ
jgi:hypothetical protein